MATVKTLRVTEREFRKALAAAFARGRADGESRVLYGLKTVARLNGSGAAVLSVAKATEDAPAPDASDAPPRRKSPRPHALILEALFAAAERGAGQDELHALADLAHDPGAWDDLFPDGGFRKAWTADAHPRGKDGRFIKKGDIQAAKSDPAKAAELRAKVRPQDAGKLEAALSGETDLRNSREVARDAGHARRQFRADRAKQVADAAAKVKGGSAGIEEFALLAHNLPYLTKSELRDVRVMTGARFGAGKSPRRRQMVDALVKYALDRGEGKTHEEAVGKRGRKPKPAAGTLDTMTGAVRHFGGIDPHSLDLKRFYANSRDATQDSIPLTVFRRGGRGLDQMAQELKATGLLVVPPGKDSSEHLLDELRRRAHTTAADLTAAHDAALEDYYRAQQEAADAGIDDARRAELVRSGEAAGDAEAAGEGLADDGGGADARPAEEGVGDDSFDFGANAESGATSGPADTRSHFDRLDQDLSPADQALVAGVASDRDREPHPGLEGDHAAERYDAAKEKQGRMAQWAQDKPESLAARGASAAADKRVGAAKQGGEPAGGLRKNPGQGEAEKPAAGGEELKPTPSARHDELEADTRRRLAAAESPLEGNRYGTFTDAALGSAHRGLAATLAAYRKQLKEHGPGTPAGDTAAAEFAKREPRFAEADAELKRRVEVARLNRRLGAIAESRGTGRLTVSEAEMRELLAAQKDAYKDAGLKRDGGRYPYSPDAFKTSDLTGAKVRHYVELPDGRIAHPDELTLAQKRGRLSVVPDAEKPGDFATASVADRLANPPAPRSDAAEAAAPLTAAGIAGAQSAERAAAAPAAYRTGDLRPDILEAGKRHGVNQPAALRQLQREAAAGDIDPAAVLADAVKDVAGKTYRSGGKVRNYSADDLAPYDVQQAARRHRARRPA